LYVFWFSLDYFILLLFAFVVFGFISSVICQEIGIFCVKSDVKPNLNQSNQVFLLTDWHYIIMFSAMANGAIWLQVVD